MVSDRCIIGTTGIIVLGAMQGIAWYLGYDGQVFAFTSGVIGLIIGSFFNPKEAIKKSLETYKKEVKQ